jgi:WD40 repeat protein/predicted Ser/Thr protein kinase
MYCLNPQCPKPANNPPRGKFCQNCGASLLLQKRYRAIKLIGQGGFGKTFLGVDETQVSKPNYVIKQFFPDAQGTDSQEKAIELFQQEALRLGELGHHQQIPELFAYFTEDKRQYLVQEYIDGQNLKDFIAIEGTFKERQIRELLANLLPLIKYIHSHNIIHRDIKPENIIRRSDGLLVLVDFGAAKFVTGTKLFKTGTTIGSPEYVAPEQARGKAVFASDLYSLGATCLYLITQISPFDLFDVGEHIWVWRDYLVDNPISEELGEILDKLVDNAVSRRFKSVTQVLRALNQGENNLANRADFGLNSGILAASSKSGIKKNYSINTRNNYNNYTNQNSQNYISAKCIRTLTGHKDAVFSIAFSPDSQTIASVSGYWDKSIKLWDVKTGQEIDTLKGHTDGVRSVAFSPDGTILASGGSSTDKTIKLWDVEIGQEINTLYGHTDLIYSLAFSPDGFTLISGSQDCTIKVWNLQTDKEVYAIKAHADWVRSVTFSHNGQFIASASDDETVRLWSNFTLEEVYVLEAHSQGISSIRFSPDDQILATASNDATIKLWDVKRGENISTLKGHDGAVYSIAFSPDGEFLVSASEDWTIKLWRVSTGEEILTLKEHKSTVNSVRFSPDGNFIASCSRDNTIKIWALVF